jgi:hypothetical protein
MRLLLHTGVGWLFKENVLRRFLELINSVSEFLIDTQEM